MDILTAENPTKTKTSECVAKTFFEKGDHAAALEAAESWAYESLRSEEELYQLSGLLAEYGHAVRAAKFLKGGVERFPESVRMALEFAQMEWIAGDTSGAIQTVRNVIKRDPGLAFPWRFYGMLQYTAGNYFEAFAGYSASVMLEKNTQLGMGGRECAFRMLTGQRSVVAKEGNVSARFVLSGRSITVDVPHAFGMFYEAKELATVAALVPRGGRVVDVGGNLGNHAAFFLQALAPRELHVFEPNPVCVEILRENVFQNVQQGTRLELHQKGVGAERGEFFLNEHDDLNNGLVPIGSGERSRAVEVVALDEVIGGAELLKIDVEGMEIDVLAGAQRILRECRPYLFIEVQRRNTAKFDAFVSENSYNVVKIFPGEDYVNVIAAPMR